MITTKASLGAFVISKEICLKLLDKGYFLNDKCYQGGGKC